jgi:hypothetical protein
MIGMFYNHLMDINFSRDQLRSFHTLAQKKTFSAAAESLGITQAAFSIRIQKLEEELQHTLVIRIPFTVEFSGWRSGGFNPSAETLETSEPVDGLCGTFE